MIAARFFGVLGVIWAILAPVLLIFWFSFADRPWSVPFGDLTNPVQLMMAAIVYGLPSILTFAFFADRLCVWKNDAQD